MLENNKDSKIIFLYRHGETNWNVDDRVTGQLEDINTYFTERGYKQIEKISEILEENQIEVIYSSDLNRATETTILANQRLKLPVFYSKEIRGLNMGKYQGLLLDDFINQKEVQECFLNYDLTIIGGESINNLNKRLVNFIKKVCDETTYKRIAIITHSAAISNLRASLLKDKYIKTNKCTLLYRNNEVSVLDYECSNSK